MLEPPDAEGEELQGDMVHVDVSREEMPRDLGPPWPFVRVDVRRGTPASVVYGVVAIKLREQRVLGRRQS